MAFKVSITKETRKLLDTASANGYVPTVRKEFCKRGPVKMKQAIFQDIIRGISPVKGGGKWKQYSKSYKKAIRRQASNQILAASPTKRISPVNLRLTGQMLSTSFSKCVGGFLRRWRLEIGFKDFLANVHNNLGAGKSKVIRRLLPDRPGEKFNKKITNTLLQEMQKSADKVAKDFSRQ